MQTSIVTQIYRDFEKVLPLKEFLKTTGFSEGWTEKNLVRTKYLILTKRGRRKYIVCDFYFYCLMRYMNKRLPNIENKMLVLKTKTPVRR